MKILLLEAENVKRLKAIRIEPDGAVVEITGKNAAGKSSVIDSISYVIDGKSAQPGQPVRQGEDKAIIKADLGELLVKRTITAAGGGSLVVTDAEGNKFSSPQAILDGLKGALSFDPMGFQTLDRLEQAKALRDLQGIDTTKLDAKRKALFEERTVSSREAKKLRAQFDALPVSDVPLPDQEVSVAALADDLEKIGKRNATRNNFERSVAAAEWDLEKAQEGMESAQSFFNEARDKADEATAWAKEQLAKLTGGADHESTEVVTKAIAAAEDTNLVFRAKQSWEKFKGEMEDAETEVQCLTADLEAIDAEKAALLDAVEFPIEGLGIDDAGVTYNGIPFDQASSAEQLRVTVAIGIAANPRLNVLLIRNGSLLDPDSREMVRKMAEDSDAQLWIENVGPGGPSSVVIEDGEVVSCSSG